MECLLCARPGLRYQAHGVTYQNRCAPCSVECILLCGKTVNASKQANKINAVCGQCCEEKKQGTKRGASGSREKEQHTQRLRGLQPPGHANGAHGPRHSTLSLCPPCHQWAILEASLTGAGGSVSWGFCLLFIHRSRPLLSTLTAPNSPRQ